ncbi:MAG: efflux RND transporter periplasmic adaptor subunit, partial [Pseudomonas sp.]
ILPVPPKPLDPSGQGGGGGSPSSSGKSGSARVVLYTVLLDVDNADNALMAEMTTQVFFVAGAAKDVLTAPVSALQNSTRAGRQQVRVVARNGSIETREVSTGLSDRLQVQILDGVNEGDHLLIGPVDGNEG